MSWRPTAVQRKRYARAKLRKYHELTRAGRCSSCWHRLARKDRTKCLGCSDKDSARAAQRRWKEAGIEFTEAAYIQLFQRQQRRCAVCRRKVKRRLCLDHNHRTGKVRGLLCTRCNRGIGAFEDSARLLTRAANYVRGT